MFLFFNFPLLTGNPIRIVDGSANDVCNTLDISSDGSKFVCGGGDKLVKVWAYDEGVVGARGVGHSGEITRVVISPDQQTVVSIGDEGAIFLWIMPEFSVDESGAIITPHQQMEQSFRSANMNGQESDRYDSHRYEPEEKNSYYAQSASSSSSRPPQSATSQQSQRTPLTGSRR